MPPKTRHAVRKNKSAANSLEPSTSTRETQGSPSERRTSSPASATHILCNNEQTPQTGEETSSSEFHKESTPVLDTPPSPRIVPTTTIKKVTETNVATIPVAITCDEELQTCVAAEYHADKSSKLRPITGTAGLKRKRTGLDGTTNVRISSPAEDRCLNGVTTSSKMGNLRAIAPALPKQLDAVPEANPSLSSYLHAMQTTMQHLSSNTSTNHVTPAVDVEGSSVGPSAYRQGLNKQRERMFQHAIMESIMDSNVVNSPLRTSIAQEIKARIGCLLNDLERNPENTAATLKMRGRKYWADIYSKFHQIDIGTLSLRLHHQSLDNLYSKRDIHRALYFWAMHHNNMSYGEIAFELHLPLNLLLPRLIQFVDLN